MDNHNNNRHSSDSSAAKDPLSPSTTYGSLQTYTAGEDSSRLATLAKEFGLSRQREPRPQIRLRVPEYALDTLNKSSLRLKKIYGRVKSFSDGFEEMRISASLGMQHEDENDDTFAGTIDEKRVLLSRNQQESSSSSTVGLLLTRLSSVNEFEEDVEQSTTTTTSSFEQQQDHEDPHAHGLGGTLSSATLGIIKGMVGPAILYLPHGFAGAGYLVAIPLLFLSTAMFLWSSTCLLECWKMETMRRQEKQQQQQQRRQKIALSYPELAYRAWGRRGQRLVQIGITLMQSGVCLTYLIFVPQNLRVSALLLFNVDIPHTVWLLLMVIVQIPLSWIRDIRRLTVTNLLANVLILFGLTSCLGLAMRQMGEENGGAGDESTSFLEEMVYRAKSLPAFNPDGWFLFLGTSVLLFEGSITLLVPLIEAVNTPEDKQKFPSMYRKVIIGIVSFYAFFGTACWMAIGDSVRTVMTTSLPQGMLATMIQLAYSLAVVFTFPLQNFPSLEIVCASVEKMMPKTGSDDVKHSASKMLKRSYSEISDGKRNVISSMVVVSLSIVAVLAMDDLDKVVSIMGGLFGCPLAFVLPPLIENELGKGKIGSHKKFVNHTVALLGFGAMLVSTLTTLINW
mmetsp:Transcript_3224/g.4637  ORF Transcript_3224/g.4637 Transcript_3224/m.4637 type:complete len:622 (+) Transcript_3224:288-2153(+)